MYLHAFLTLAAIIALPAFTFAQEKDQPKRLPGDEMIEKYLAAETDKLSKKFMDGAKTLDEWKERLPRLKREYLDMLGLWPLPEKTQLKANITGQVEAHGVIVEKIHFQSKPGLYVTANLYRPKDDASAQRKRWPAIVYVCGHSGKGRDGNKTAFQDHGFWFANNGYVCIVLDTLQLGEIPGVHHGTYGRSWLHAKSWGLDIPSPPRPVSPSPLLPKGADPTAFRPWWWSAGYTPAGVECWNGIRAIDYLCTLPSVDPDKIGVTGISGGGAATFWIAAADDRVKVAIPVSGMSDLEFYVKNKGVNGHCDCMFLYNTYQWDTTTIAALVAPRPMLFANSDNDPIFPMDGNRRIIAKLRDCFKMYGKPDLVDEYVSVGGHDYRPDLRIAIFKFFNKHLKGDATTKVEDSERYTPLPGKNLRVFPTDADLPKDAINGRIDETFVARAKVELPEKGKFVAWKRERIAELREKPFHSLPTEVLAAKQGKGPGAYIWAFSTNENRTVNTGLPVGNCLVIADSRAEKLVELKELEEPTFVMLPFTTPRWTNTSPPNYVKRGHALLGQTIASNDVFDAIALARYAISLWPKGIKIAGKGQAGILAAYAALFEPSIKEVVVIDPPKSHMEGPHFLGILRVLDIPEALGLLAPTPLTIIGGNDPAFDRTAEIYRLAGASDKLKRK